MVHCEATTWKNQGISIFPDQFRGNAYNDINYNKKLNGNL